MATPLYNDRGQQIGYLDNNNQFHPIQRDGNANRVYKPQGGIYYNKNGSVNVTASEMNKPKSSAGMPSNVQNNTPASVTTKSSAGMSTSARQAQAAQQDKEAISKAHSDYNYNAAITAKEAMPKTTVTNTATAKPAVTNTAGVDTATADTAATQPVINDFDLNLYDKYAADRIKKKFNKIGKADQYQPFINDFYGSDTMDDNRYNELMNKYELGNTFKNDFDLGKANYMETYDIARRNKVNTENKAKKQEEKQAKADANEEQRVKSQVADMLKKATPYELTQFMVGQGPIYETIAKYSKYFG